MLARLKGRISKLLPKNNFARGVSVLVGGTAGAQFLLLIAAPILTRLYSPDDFGMLAVYVGLLSILAVVASLRYELAIPLPESDKEAAGAVILSVLVVTGLTLCCAGVVWLAGDDIAHALGVPQLAGIMWLLPLGIFLQGIYNVLVCWGIRTKQYSIIARTRLRQAFVTLTVQLLGFSTGSVALVVGQASGHGAGGATLARITLRNPAFLEWQWRDVWQAARRYRDFPLYSAGSGFLNAAGGQLPALMFAALFGASAAGLYALAHRVLAMPMTMVGEAVGKVFFSNAAEAHRRGELGALVRVVHNKLAQLAMPPAVALMVISPDLFTLIFGESWRVAGEFARWMTPWLYVVFVTSPLSTLSYVMGKQRQELAFQVLLALSRAIGICIGAIYGDLLLAIILFSGASAVCWLGYLIWIINLTGNPARTLLAPSLRILLFSIAIAMPLAVTVLCSANIFAWGASLFVFMGLMLAYYWQYSRNSL